LNSHSGIVNYARRKERVRNRLKEREGEGERYTFGKKGEINR
jgi:hypothetical protein